jgi:hypothetical protein
MAKLDRTKVYTKEGFTFEYWGKGHPYQWRVTYGDMPFSFVSESSVAAFLTEKGA